MQKKKSYNKYASAKHEHLNYHTEDTMVVVSLGVGWKINFVLYKIKWWLSNIITDMLVKSAKNSHSLKVVENTMQQCCAAHIVHSCQQYCPAIVTPDCGLIQAQQC